MTPERGASRRDDGRRASLAAMIAAEPDRLRRRSISLGVATDDAEDVAQTTLLRAWRSIEHLRTLEPGGMCSWLDAIARNAAADLARQRARRPAAALDEDLPDGASVSAEVEMRMILNGALGAIQSLPALFPQQPALLR